MRLLRTHQFWVGVLVGYLLICVFPQLNFRSMAKSKKGGG